MTRRKPKLKRGGGVLDIRNKNKTQKLFKILKQTIA